MIRRHLRKGCFTMRGIYMKVRAEGDNQNSERQTWKQGKCCVGFHLHLIILGKAWHFGKISSFSSHSAREKDLSTIQKHLNALTHFPFQEKGGDLPRMLTPS